MGTLTRIMGVSVQERVPYFGYGKNIRLSNADVELIVPTEFGPRILRYAFVGGDNVLGEVSPREQRVDTPFGEPWFIYGGHRLWYAPENEVGTYAPDNSPVAVHIGHGHLTLRQPLEPHTGLEKVIEITLGESGSRVVLTHHLNHRGDRALELAPWALTVMARNGRAIFPQAPFVPHPRALAPARPLVLWPFTRMNDPRWTWGDRYFFLRQDPAREDAQKIGFYNEQGWMAYHVEQVVFVKQHRPQPGAHADFGCNAQAFTNHQILELETLGPLVRLDPGASVSHQEVWTLHRAPELGDSERSVAAALAPMLTQGTPDPA